MSVPPGAGAAPGRTPEPALFPLWHLAHAADWEAARASGRYEVSTRGRTLRQEGFIHCSYPHQLGQVARTFFADDPEPLVVLELDRDALARHGVRVRVEEVPHAGGQRFPHVFGPITPDAVTSVRPAAFDEGGGLVLGTPESPDAPESPGTPESHDAPDPDEAPGAFSARG